MNAGMMMTKTKKKKKLVCGGCGTTNNVRETLDPYIREIGKRDVEVSLCDKCYRERVWDI